MPHHPSVDRTDSLQGTGELTDPLADAHSTTPRASRRKVTQVLYSGLGGHASVAFSLLAADKAARWDPSLLFVGTEPLAGDYHARCEELGVHHECVQTETGRPWSAWRTIYEALRKVAPDAVILHSVTSLPPVALYCATRRVRLLVVEHTPVAVKTGGEWLLSGAGLLLARRVVVLTKAYRDALLARSRIAAVLQRKLSTISNGIDIDKFAPTAGGPPPTGARIGMAARFSASKRQDVLVEAFDRLVQARPDLPWQLTLAGSGDQLQRVEALAAGSAAAGRIAFPGQLGERELLGWFRSLDLYVHASDAETLSTSMLQALAMGLPTIGSPVEGITNLLCLPGAEVGTLARANTPQAWTEAILSVATDPRWRGELGRAGQSMVRREFSHHAMFRAYDALLEEK